MQIIMAASSGSGWIGWTALLGALLWVADLVIKIAAIGIIPGNRKASSAMAWLILILILPFAGLVIFLFLGRTNIGKGRLARQQEADKAIRAATETLLAAPASEPAYLPSAAVLNHRLGSMPFQPGNLIQLFPGYSDSIDAMTEEVSRATTSIEVEFYISAWDNVTTPFFEALSAAADRGVKVRFLFDHMGSRGIPGYQDFLKKLEASGIEWHPMLPIRPLKGEFRRPDLRNHRKLLVVDGRIAFTGSQNLTEPGYNKPKNHAAGREWVELMARVDGPTVNALRAVFAADWFVETGERIGEEISQDTVTVHPDAVSCQIVPSGPGYSTENNLRLFTLLIHSARHRVSITSPYFVPDESLLYAVTTAAQRGVEIELFVSEEGDQFMVYHAQCSFYRALLEAGVRIHLYPAPAVLHSKHFSIDDDVAVIGSSNMDMRSFALNYEVSMMLTGGDIVSRFREVEDTYRSLGRELTLAEWTQRKPAAKYLDNAMRLTAALQ